MDSENTPRGLSDSEAMDALMGISPRDEDPKRTPESKEVTESEETVKPEEAAVRTKQSDSTNVGLDEHLPEEAEAEEDTEEDPDGDESEEETEEEVAEEDSEDTEDEEDPDDEPDNRVLFHDEDGNPVTEGELKKSYLRQSDYTRKMQEVAQQRNQIQQASEAMTQERQVLAQNLEVALQTLEPQLANFAKVDWDALSRDDPYAYAEQRALYDQSKARYTKSMEAAQALVQQNQMQKQQQMQRKLAEETQKLQMVMPDMADPTKASEVKHGIAKFAKKIGLTDQETKSITDHRMIVVLDMARKFDELQQGKLSVAKKKVSKAPKRSVKAGKPVSKTQRAAKAQEAQRAKLKASGSLDDAVALLMNQ